MKNRVLGPGPGGTRVPGSRSAAPGGRGFGGLAVTLPLPAEPPMDGSAAQSPPGPGGGRATATGGAGEPAAPQTPLGGAAGRGGGEGRTLAALGLLGSQRGVPPASAVRLATETRGWEAASRGWSGAGVGCCRAGAPREPERESGARAGKRVKVGAVPSQVPAPMPAGPAVAAPREWLEEATGGGPAAGAVEVLKILAKRDPRSNTATFMSWPWKCCPGCWPNLKSAGSRAAGLHPPPPAGIGTRRPGAGTGVAGSPQAAHPGSLWCSLHPEDPPRALGPARPDLPRRGEQSLLCPSAARPRGPGVREPTEATSAAASATAS